MPIALILVGGILVVVAFNDTMGELASHLKGDIPGYFVWGVAIAAILGLGYLPGMKVPSRWLLGLVILVIVVTQYKAIVSGITGFAATGAAQTGKGDAPAAADPAFAFASSPKGALPSPAAVAGDPHATAAAGGGGGGAGGVDPMAMMNTVMGMAGGMFGGLMGGGGGTIMDMAGGMGGMNPMDMMGGGFGGMMGGGGFGGGFGGMDMSSLSSVAMLALL